MTNPFQQLMVSVSPIGYTLLEWRLVNNFTPETTLLQFDVYWAELRDGTWTKLTSEPVMNDTLWQDTVCRKHGQYSTGYYRVEMTDGLTVYSSDPVTPQGSLTFQEYLIAREILRKEVLRFRKSAGSSQGYLLKRRYWGTICTDCTDPDTHLSVNSQCPLCYGTSFVGGYFPAFQYYMEFKGTAPQELKTDKAVGPDDQFMRQGRCLAYPVLQTDDIFVSGKSNERYFIKTIKRASEITEVPLIYEITMAKIPQERIEFQIPVAVVEDGW
jgi:hypothetical protein